MATIEAKAAEALHRLNEEVEFLQQDIETIVDAVAEALAIDGGDIDGDGDQGGIIARFIGDIARERDAARAERDDALAATARLAEVLEALHQATACAALGLRMGGVGGGVLAMKEWQDDAREIDDARAKAFDALAAVRGASSAPQEADWVDVTEFVQPGSVTFSEGRAAAALRGDTET